ncbi:hypothetical protein [Methylobacterium sp. JK268]
MMTLFASAMSTQASDLTAECRATRQRGCECSLSSVELPMSFGDTAGILEVYYREYPDERYEAMLVSLIRQCLLPWPRPSEELARSAAAITHAPEPAQIRSLPRIERRQ